MRKICMRSSKPFPLNEISLNSINPREVRDMNQLCDSSNSHSLNLREFPMHAIYRAMAKQKAEKPPLKRSNESPAGPTEEAEQDAKDPTHEKETNPKNK